MCRPKPKLVISLFGDGRGMKLDRAKMHGTRPVGISGVGPTIAGTSSPSSTILRERLHCAQQIDQPARLAGFARSCGCDDDSNHSAATPQIIVEKQLAIELVQTLLYADNSTATLQLIAAMKLMAK